MLGWLLLGTLKPNLATPAGRRWLLSGQWKIDLNCNPRAWLQRSRVSHFRDGALKYVTGVHIPGLSMWNKFKSLQIRITAHIYQCLKIYLPGTVLFMLSHLILTTILWRGIIISPILQRWKVRPRDVKEHVRVSKLVSGLNKGIWLWSPCSQPPCYQPFSFS